jgi:hypothetical protein
MPISYRIDPERNFIFTTASGILTDDDILELKRRLTADPRFKVGMRELSDVRAVTELRVTTLGVRRMVDEDANQASALTSYRLAIVAGGDDTFGMARMYQMLTEGNLPHVAVFRDYEAAAQWIGAPATPGSSGS